MDPMKKDRSLIAGPAGAVFRDRLNGGGENCPSEGPEMCVIPAGRFLMGSPADEPGRSRHERLRREVAIERPFALGRYAVTFDEYDAFCSATNRPRPPDADFGRISRPAINVSWLDAAAYCAWLSAETGAEYRLPTEAEWEYACRAGSTSSYWWGAKISPEDANYRREPAEGDVLEAAPAIRGTKLVHFFERNPWGLFQMHGNIWEWCQDCWSDQHRDAPSEPEAAARGFATLRVLRGGSWGFSARGARAAYRNANPQGSRSKNVGVRVARSLRG